MRFTRLKDTTFCVSLLSSLHKIQGSGSTLFKAFKLCIRGKDQRNPHIWVSLPVAITLMNIGFAGIIDEFLPDYLLSLSWKTYDIWPLKYLEMPPWSFIFFVAGMLMLLDTLGIPTRLWQRIAIWWGVFFLLWQLCLYGVLSLFLDHVQAVGTVSAFFGLALTYTLLLLFGPPLAILSREGDIKRVQ
jgi:hypothetical protein